MTRLDILQHVCDLVDESVNDNTVKTKMLRYIERAYRECLRREYKELPKEPLSDTTVLLIDDENEPFIAFHSAWQHFMNEQDTAMSGIFKDEYEGFVIHKKPSTPIGVVDVYGVGEYYE